MQSPIMTLGSSQIGQKRRECRKAYGPIIRFFDQNIQGNGQEILRSRHEDIRPDPQKIRFQRVIVIAALQKIGEENGGEFKARDMGRFIIIKILMGSVAFYNGLESRISTYDTIRFVGEVFTPVEENLPSEGLESDSVVVLGLCLQGMEERDGLA